MKPLGQYVGISKQTEVLFLVLLGICCTIFDPSLFNLHSNLTKIWELQMDSTKFTETAQIYVKYVITGIVLVRTFTVHLYLAFYVVMLWPAVFEERPGLMLPWLTVGAIKCLATGAVSLATVLYICLKYNFAKIACWEFLLAHVIDQGPSVYMWFCVLSYYRDLKISTVRYRLQNPSLEFGIAQRRRRARTVLASKNRRDSFDDKRPFISSSTIETLVSELIAHKKKGISRSLDSLLDAMAAEAKKEEILSFHDEIVEEDNILSTTEKMMKMLKLTESDIRRAQYRKATHLRAGSWYKSLNEVEIPKKQYRTVLEKSHSDHKITKITRKSGKDEFCIFPSEAEVKITYLSNPDVQLESNEASIQSVNVTEPVPESLEIPAQVETPQTHHPSKQVKILSDNNVIVKELAKPQTPNENNKPAVITKPKPNTSRLPKRKKEEGSQVNNITEEMLRDVVGYSSKPKVKSNTVKTSRNTKSVSYNAPESLDLSTSYSPFKYDGYTLAYMESQKRAAQEKQKTKRPASSTH